MRDDAPPDLPDGDDPDSPCLTARQDDSSRNVTEPNGAGDDRDSLAEHPPAKTAEAPSTSGDAVRLAIKLAVDAGEYERAEALLSVLRRTAVAAVVVPLIDLGRRRQRPKGAV